jgi:hypothetical protein
MAITCTSCLHLKKAPGQMFVFCKMNRLPKFPKISRFELNKKGIINFSHRKLFDAAKSCSDFVNMEDEEESRLFHSSSNAL